jgi:signal transduction histidine kinase
MQGQPQQPGPALAPSDDLPLVLVVEDNVVVRNLVLRALGSTYRVASAEDGEDGLQQTRALGPDLVITDVMMPKMDGIEMIRRLRAEPELRDIPVLVLTAQNDELLRVRLLDGNVQDYVTKPFVVDEVRARVQNLIEAKRARDLLRSELHSRSGDLLGLAQELAESRRALQTALAEAEAAKETAERANLVKSNFLRIMSHELRTPLTAMQLSIRLLERDTGALGERQKNGVERIGRSYTRLLDLVDTVMEYARIESGRAQLNLTEFPPAPLLHEVADAVRSTGQQKGVGIEVIAPADGAPLRSDRHLLRLILVNIVHHALRGTSSGSIGLLLEPSDGGRSFTVRSGAVMSDEELAEIFDPLGSDDLHRRSGSGSGLGLAIVNQMVRALGGELVVHAVADGTLISVRLTA